MVNANWEYSRGDLTLPSIKFNITNFPSVAVRTKTGELVAWEAISMRGSMVMLFVKEEHRGQGLGKFVIYHLAKKLLEMGRTAFTYVDGNNKASIDVHVKCGFTLYEGQDVFFTKIKRNDL